jgi:hypothetical protein
MKKIIFVFISLSLTIICCKPSKLPTAKSNKQVRLILPDTSIHSFYFISKAEAEKMLQEPAVLKDSIWKFEGGMWKYKCVYYAKATDSLTGRRPSFYYGFENYKQLAPAQRYMVVMKNEFSKTLKVDNLDQTNGDEGFWTKDEYNNPIIIIRKDKKVYKLSGTWANSQASIDAFLLMAKKIVTTP